MSANYQILDFSGASAFDGTETVKGAFEKAKSGRPILINNANGISGYSYDITPNDTTLALLPVVVVVSDNPVSAFISVTDEDVVEINVPE